jgi:hypothetical protein
MATKAELEDLISRQTDCIRSQIDRIAALESEVALLKGGLQAAGIDAIAFLRSVYDSDSDAPLNLKIAAATTIAKTQAGPKVVNQGFILFDHLERRRLERAAQRIEAKTIDADPAA